MIIFVGAFTKNYGMGNKGSLPWQPGSMQTDTKRLHALANGNTVVMGERAYHDYKDVQKSFQTQSILVLSRNTKSLPDAEVVNSLETIINRSQTEDLWVIGGGQIFRQLLPYAQKMYLTEVDAELKADTFFPEYSPNDWMCSKTSHKADAHNKYDYTFLDLTRK